MGAPIAGYIAGRLALSAGTAVVGTVAKHLTQKALAPKPQLAVSAEKFDPQAARTQFLQFSNKQKLTPMQQQIAAKNLQAMAMAATCQAASTAHRT